MARGRYDLGTTWTPATPTRSPQLRVEAHGSTCRRRPLRPARAARHPAGHRRATARRCVPTARPAAERHLGRAGLLRHRAHLGLGARSRARWRSSTAATCSSDAPTSPACTATTPPTSCATATSGWSRPAPGATSSRTTRSAACGRPWPAPRPTCSPARTCSTPPSCPCPRTASRPSASWDPHLVHTGDEWLVGFASARKFFRFHPALAGGPTLDRLTLRGAAIDRRATEGTTILRVGDDWRVLASDGRDGRRGQRDALSDLRPGHDRGRRAGCDRTRRTCRGRRSRRPSRAGC